MRSLLKTEREVIELAIEWFRRHKPCSFTTQEHLANPTVNMTTMSEFNLARAVANYQTKMERIKHLATKYRGKNKR
jgi:hypothetical protein